MGRHSGTRGRPDTAMVAGVVSIGLGVLLLAWGLISALPIGGDASVTPTPAGSIAVTAPPRPATPSAGASSSELIAGESGEPGLPPPR